MHKSKDDSVTALTKGIEFLFKKNKADWIKGKGKIVGKGQVEVTAADGSVQTLEAKNIVIATGSEPTPLPGVAFEAGKVIDSTGALSLPAVPKKLIVVGAGIIIGMQNYLAGLGEWVLVVQGVIFVVDSCHSKKIIFQRSTRLRRLGEIVMHTLISCMVN
jgi:dihydrolipoamide dehydrogenase